MAVDIKKMKPTYGHDASGKRQDLFLDSGKAYTADGQRVGEGWTVQTGGGTFKQSPGGQGGYAVDSHNRPSMDSYLESFRDVVGQQQQQNQFKSDKDYGQLGKDRYSPIYEAQRRALEQQRSSGVRDLESNIAGVNTEYDRNMEMQESMNRQASNNVNANLLSRGLTRGSAAISGMANAEYQGNLAKERINTDRANTINNIHGKIQSLREGIGGQLSSLDSTRPIMEQQYGEQMEDRDFGMFMQQAGLNQGTNNMMLQAQLGMLENQFGMDMSDWNYQNELNRAIRGVSGRGLEGQLSQREYADELEKERDKYDLDQGRFRDRYTPGTPEYEGNVLSRDWNRDDKMWDFKNNPMMQPQTYSGGGGYSGGGSSYTPWGGSKSSGGSGGGNVANEVNSVARQVIGQTGINSGSAHQLNRFKQELNSDTSIKPNEKKEANRLLDNAINRSKQSQGQAPWGGIDVKAMQKKLDDERKARRDNNKKKVILPDLTRS